MTTVNADGLFIKFGLEEAVANKGGVYSTLGPLQITEVRMLAADIQSATGVRVGSVDGSGGVQIPKGAIIEQVDFVVETAFTSSGTLASATILLGLVQDDYATENDLDGFTTASLTGSGLALQTIGTKTLVTRATTGAGAFLTAHTGLALSGYVTVGNSTHGSNPLAAGVLTARIYWRMA